MRTSRGRRRRPPNQRVRGKRRIIPLEAGLPAAALVFVIRWMALLWGWGWVFGTFFIYLGAGYVAADQRAHQVRDRPRARQSYLSYALPAALVAWGAGWLGFSVTLMIWMLFQDSWGRLVSFAVWLPLTLPLAFFGGVLGGQWRQKG